MANEPIITVTLDQAKLAEVHRLVDHIRGGLGRVMSRAINRTMNSARVRISREISGELQLGVRMVKQRIYLRRASKASLQGFLGMGTRPYDLAKHFKAKDNRPGGVSVRVTRGQSTVLPRAFIPTGGGSGWRMWNKVLMRSPRGAAGTVTRSSRAGSWLFEHSSGEKPTWKDPMDGRQLVSRLPVVSVRGPTLAELWEGAPQMVNNAVAYSQHTLEKNVDDQVSLLLMESFDPGI